MVLRSLQTDSRFSHFSPCINLRLIYSFFRFKADINDMKISYVLLDKSNATSDIFYFTVQDNGKKPLNYFILTCTDTSMEP